MFDFKKNDTFEGRVCVNYMLKEDTSSPTKPVESLLLSSIVDVKENHSTIISLF